MGKTQRSTACWQRSGHSWLPLEWSHIGAECAAQPTSRTGSPGKTRLWPESLNGSESRVHCAPSTRRSSSAPRTYRQRCRWVQHCSLWQVSGMGALLWMWDVAPLWRNRQVRHLWHQMDLAAAHPKRRRCTLLPATTECGVGGMF